MATSHTTSRHMFSADDELWKPFQDLAAHRHTTASALLRQLIVREVEGARVSGELKRARAKRGAA